MPRRWRADRVDPPFATAQPRQLAVPVGQRLSRTMWQPGPLVNRRAVQVVGIPVVVRWHVHSVGDLVRVRDDATR